MKIKQKSASCVASLMKLFLLPLFLVFMVANVRGEATSKKQQSGMREGGEAWLMCAQDTSPRRSIAYFVLCEGEKKITRFSH